MRITSSYFNSNENHTDDAWLSKKRYPCNNFDKDYIFKEGRCIFYQKPLNKIENENVYRYHSNILELMHF